MRDQVSKSGRSKPPPGWYNFDEQTGKRLMEIKNKRDPKNVYSLASRMSWSDDDRQLMKSKIMFEKKKREVKQRNENDIAAIYSVSSVKDGEVDPTDCLTPKKIHQPNYLQTTLESLTSDDVDEDDDLFDEVEDKGSNDSNVVDVDENGNVNVH